MKKKLLLLSASAVTLLGGLSLLASPANANIKGCAEESAGCKLVKANCTEGWSSTGDPVTVCTCSYAC